AAAGTAGGCEATAVTANGYVVARTRASVSSKVPGRLAYLAVSEGSDVKSGDVIARLDNADYEAQVTQAQAGVANARAQLIEAQAERDQLQREAQRVQEIRAQNAQLVSQPDVDVNEAYIARVHHGQPAKITLDAYPDTSFGGQVRQVVPTADRQRATVQVKVSILDHDPRILPEMGARVDFLEPERPAAARGAAPT